LRNRSRSRRRHHERRCNSPNYRSLPGSSKAADRSNPGDEKTTLVSCRAGACSACPVEPLLSSQSRHRSRSRIRSWQWSRRARDRDGRAPGGILRQEIPLLAIYVRLHMPRWLWQPGVYSAWSVGRLAASALREPGNLPVRNSISAASCVVADDSVLPRPRDVTGCAPRRRPQKIIRRGHPVRCPGFRPSI